MFPAKRGSDKKEPKLPVLSLNRHRKKVAQQPIEQQQMCEFTSARGVVDKFAEQERSIRVETESDQEAAERNIQHEEDPESAFLPETSHKTELILND